MAAADQTFLGTSSGPGLYVHVPFCLAKCDYCDFYSVAPTPKTVDAYLARLAEEASLRLSPPFSGGIRTVFIGGGNPTVLGPRGLDRLFDILQMHLECARIEEWTVETNPETLSAEVCRCLSRLSGIRLSVGLQRLEDGELVLLGRNGSVAAGFRALDAAFSVTENVGIDLILGLPGRPFGIERLSSLLDRFPLQHLSSYFLSIEDGTPLAARAAAGQIGDPADVGPEDLFFVSDLLQKRGLHHYEISNFALSGRECVHNLNYWLGGEYIGLGPAAVGTMASRRVANPSDLSAWLIGTASEVEELKEHDRFRERVMLRLRLLELGLDLDTLAHDFPQFFPGFRDRCRQPLTEGFLAERENCLRITRKGLPWADRILSGLLSDLT